MWKPDTDFVSNLVQCGVDHRILQKLLDTAEANQRVSSLLSAQRNFVAKAVAQQIQFSNDEESHRSYVLPLTYMKKDWRPRKVTIQLLVEKLEYDRVDVGLLREEFKRRKVGLLYRDWDCLFIQFMLLESMLIENETITDVKAETKPVDKTESKEENISDEMPHQNQQAIRAVVQSLEKKFNASYHFNYALNPDWRPTPFIVDRLKHEGIDRSFIFDDAILARFRDWFYKYGSVQSNINELYYLYLKRSFRLRYEMLLRLKKKLEVKAGHHPQV